MYLYVVLHSPFFQAHFNVPPTRYSLLLAKSIPCFCCLADRDTADDFVPFTIDCVQSNGLVNNITWARRPMLQFDETMFNDGKGIVLPDYVVLLLLLLRLLVFASFFVLRTYTIA